MTDPHTIHFDDDHRHAEDTQDTPAPSPLDVVWGMEPPRCELLEDADADFLAAQAAHIAKLRAEREAERQRQEARFAEVQTLTPAEARQRIRLAWARRVARGDVRGECPLLRGGRV